MMYHHFYQMREAPFDLDSNQRFLFLPEPHREVLSNLEYGISNRKGITLLIGEVGTGKTTLLTAAIKRAATNCVCIHLRNPKLTRDEFFEFMARELGLCPNAASSKAVFVSELEGLLASRLERGQSATLIVDEAQTLSDDLLEEIRLLTNMEMGLGRLLPVVLVGQPELGDRLNEPSMRHLKQRVALRCTLRPLSLRETAGYIAARIRVAGGAAESVFTREAVQLIFDVSGGVPRVISVLCDNALVTGYAANVRPVGSALVREVCDDFDLHHRTLNGTKPNTAEPVKHTGASEKSNDSPPIPSTREVTSTSVSVEDGKSSHGHGLFRSGDQPRRFGFFKRMTHESYR